MGTDARPFLPIYNANIAKIFARLMLISCPATFKDETLDKSGPFDTMAGAPQASRNCLRQIVRFQAYRRVRRDRDD
jgi:hypothetical protein